MSAGSDLTREGNAVFLTGSTGFVGSHVMHALLSSGYRVRALVREGSRALPQHPGLTIVHGDLLQPGTLTRPMEGCDFLVHVAALYSFSPARRAEIQRTNVAGTAGILEAARIAGVWKAVVTSSSATVGPARNGRLPTEDDWAVDDTASPYHHSKVEQERAALAAQLPVTLILPTAPVGAGDWKPTPTGKMILDFMRGRIFASLGGGLNVVAVEDVASAHVAALRAERPRERYLIGGENLSLESLWTRLAEICGRTPPTRRIPYGVALALGWGDELRCRLATRMGRGGATPVVPLEGVRMARHNMWVDDRRARAELGHSATPVTEALARAVLWYHDHGYTA